MLDQILNLGQNYFKRYSSWNKPFSFFSLSCSSSDIFSLLLLCVLTSYSCDTYNFNTFPCVVFCTSFWPAMVKPETSKSTLNNNQELNVSVVSSAIIKSETTRKFSWWTCKISSDYSTAKYIQVMFIMVGRIN